MRHARDFQGDALMPSDRARWSRRLWALGGGVAVVLLAIFLWLWAFGGMADLRLWAAEGQRTAQNAMAGALRGLRTGSPGAVWSLCAVTFTYGLFHAVGPGHGKVVLGGYGLSRRVALRRLAVLSLLASMAQAAMAVGLVVIGVWAFDWGRGEMTNTAERLMAPVSYGAMALLGLYLVVRGMGRIWRLLGGAPRPAFDGAATAAHPSPAPLRSGLAGLARQQVNAAQDPAEQAVPAARFLALGRGAAATAGPICPDCGHRHGPSLDEVAGLRSFREAIVLIGVIALRPCTGAVFVLLLTWRMGVLYAGVLGAFAMGLGTALITMAVAMGAAGVQRGMTRLPAALHKTRWIAAGLEVLAGAGVALICAGLLWPHLAAWI